MLLPVLLRVTRGERLQREYLLTLPRTERDPVGDRVALQVRQGVLPGFRLQLQVATLGLPHQDPAPFQLPTSVMEQSANASTACFGGISLVDTIDSLDEVIQNRITMSATVTVRDLRNQFPKVRKLVETQGEVVLTEKGRPRYRLIAYTPAAGNKAPAPKDYIERMSRFQPRALDAAQVEALHDENRGDR
jgi:antitoxin (DNA-binding transcriptional repressor) of toxin-antitoxin stability system